MREAIRLSLSHIAGREQTDADLEELDIEHESRNKTAARAAASDGTK